MSGKKSSEVKTEVEGDGGRQSKRLKGSEPVAAVTAVSAEERDLIRGGMVEDDYVKLREYITGLQRKSKGGGVAVTALECRRSLPVAKVEFSTRKMPSANMINKVHNFLETAGIINVGKSAPNDSSEGPQSATVRDVAKQKTHPISARISETSCLCAILFNINRKYTEKICLPQLDRRVK
jgi:hypothetical protein